MSITTLDQLSMLRRWRQIGEANRGSHVSGIELRTMTKDQLIGLVCSLVVASQKRGKNGPTLENNPDGEAEASDAGHGGVAAIGAEGPRGA